MVQEPRFFLRHGDDAAADTWKMEELARENAFLKQEIERLQKKVNGVDLKDSFARGENFKADLSTQQAASFWEETYGDSDDEDDDEDDFVVGGVDSGADDDEDPVPGNDKKRRKLLN